MLKKYLHKVINIIYYVLILFFLLILCECKKQEN